MDATSDLINKIEEMMLKFATAEAARRPAVLLRQAAEDARRQSEAQRVLAEISRNIAEEHRRFAQNTAGFVRIGAAILAHSREQEQAETRGEQHLLEVYRKDSEPVISRASLPDSLISLSSNEFNLL